MGSNPTSRPNFYPSPQRHIRVLCRAPRNSRLSPHPHSPHPPQISSPARPAGHTPRGSPASTPADVPIARLPASLCRRVLTSVEVNYTFRKLPTAEQLQAWLGHTARLSLQLQGAAAHHPLSASPRTRDDTLAEFLAAIAACAQGRQTRRHSLSASAQLQSRPPRLAAFLALLRHSSARRSSSPSSSATKAGSLNPSTKFCGATTPRSALRKATTSSRPTSPRQLLATIVCAATEATRQQNSRPSLSVSLSLPPRSEVFAYFKHEDEPTGALNAISMLRLANKKFHAANERSAERGC